VKPTYAVATCGDKWKGGQDQLGAHLLNRLARQGIKLLRTDKVGDVVFTTDGQSLDVQTFPALAPKGARAP
jgi:beta-lactamase superfamily II metal-dependent hydrolase